MTSKRATRSSSKSLVRAQVHNRQRHFKILTPAVKTFCSSIAEALDQRAGTLSVVFIGLRKMRLLNERYRGKSYPTDVLSFRYPGEYVEGRPFLGEIVIAPSIAWAHARRSNLSPEREIRKLLLHGILHLLGYDHETDDGEMNRIQNRLLRNRAFVDSAPVAETRDKE